MGFMSDPAQRRATYQDLLSVPGHLVAEIVDGELVVSPRPAGPHSRAASALGMEIGGPFDRGRGGPGGWWIIDEPELHFGENTLVPDLAGWRRERLPVYPDGPFVTLAPDWVCEVLSERTRRLDRVRKMPIYAREGVSWVWIADPVAETLEVFRLQAGVWVLASSHVGSDDMRAEPFAAAPLALGALWDRGQPR